MPCDPYSAFNDWHSIRRPPIAAACACCPALPRIAAVDAENRAVGTHALGQLDGGGAADSLGAPGDEGDFSVQFHIT